MTEIDALRRRASEVREYLCGSVPGAFVRAFKRFPVGCCKAASVLLLQWLHDKEDVRDARLITNARRPNPKTPGEDASHAWIEAGGVIVDITCGQFSDSPDAICVSRDRTWHESFSGQSSYPMSEFVPLAGDHLRAYEVMAVVLSRAERDTSLDGGSDS